MTIPLFLGYTVLCDRYVYDLFIDLASSDKDNWLPQAFWGKALLSSSLANRGTTILFETDVREAIKRKKDVMSFEYHKNRQYLYKRLSSQFFIPVVNTSKSFDNVEKEIKEIIKQ